MASFSNTSFNVLSFSTAAFDLPSAGAEGGTSGYLSDGRKKHKKRTLKSLSELDLDVVSRPDASMGTFGPIIEGGPYGGQPQRAFLQGIDESDDEEAILHLLSQIL